LSLVNLAAALRRAGIPVGTDAALAATQALARIDLAQREDVRSALRCTLVADRADQQVFDQLFDLLYPAEQAPPIGSHPQLPRSQDLPPAPGGRRLAAAIPNPSVRTLPAPDLIERDAAGSASEHEVLGEKDFEQMSRDELELARRMLSRARRPRAQQRTRRFAAAQRGGQLDLRRMLRDARCGLWYLRPRYRSARRRPRDWVLLIDISGSMTSYARMALHLAHALTQRRSRIETFLFATRLTRITRTLQTADPDVALERVARAAEDWDSGTRIGESLAEFNLRWARRVLTRSPVVVLLTDGLERSSTESLAREVARLARNCHELVWINPLRRNPNYAPLAAGAAVLARYATRMYSAHNVASLLALAQQIDARTGTRPARTRRVQS
jgi:hypothetical protein